MESQMRNESLNVTKEDLDQNMNNTVTIIKDCTQKENAGNTFAAQKEVNTEVETVETDSQIDIERTAKTNESDSMMNMSFINVTRAGEQLHNYLIDNVEVANTAVEKTLNADEEIKSNEIDVNKIATVDYAEENSVDKQDYPPPKTSILASELMSGSLHAGSSNIADSSSSSTRMVKCSQEAIVMNKSSDISKSKVKQRRRGSAWTDDETDFLMEVWAQQSELMKQKGGDESVTCAPVYRLISRSMAELGFDKSWEQCKTRIHTLKRAYKITKDEIDAGAQTITYCRHFDKLEIISGDNAQITPGMLASGLERERKQRDTRLKGKKQPVKRKLVVGENPNLVKRNSNGNSSITTSGIIPQLLAQTSTLSVTGNSGQTQNCSSSNMTWYPPQPGQQQQQQQQPLKPPQQQQQQQTQHSFLTQTSSTVQQIGGQVCQVSPAQTSFYSYQQPVAGAVTPPPPYSSSNVATSHNGMSIKPERSDNIILDQHSMVSSSTNWHTAQSSTLQSVLPPTTTSTGSDIERMRLDLEMRKLEVERNKIEMEERQRREDRDHQYRMMQLLLFGLGQQNISQLLSGQGSDVTQAHNSTDLLRALEHGLVPGGSQKVNEKGLSFSEL